MSGDDAVRHCAQCERSVYNLSMMSSEQIEELIAGDQQICGRFYQRADGTVMTADCPTGARKRRRKKLLVSAGAGLLAAAGVALAGDQPVAPAGIDCKLPADRAPVQRKAPAEVPRQEIEDHEMIMGELMPAEPIEIRGKVEPVEE